MKNILLKISLVFLLFIVFTIKVFSSYPNYVGYVNDFAKVLSSDFSQKLNNKLLDYKNKTTNEVAIVTVDTTGSQSVEEYSGGIFNQWGIGKKEKDNGVLMFFAMKDHKMRIEVGRGLEGELTDIESAHILNDVVRPEFKQQHFEDGINKGVDALISSLAVSSATMVPGTNNFIPLIIIIMVGIIIFIFCLAISSLTPLGGEGDNRIRGLWVPKKGSRWGESSLGVINNEYNIPIVSSLGSMFSSDNSDDSSDSSSGSSGFGGFGGGSFGGGMSVGGGASSGW